MSDYIERDKAFNAILKLIPKVDDDGYCWVIRGDAAMAIERIPAADVRPVVRGHWISEEEAEEKGDYSLRDACSVCGHCDWDCTESAGFNYCPNCGADMREES